MMQYRAITATEIGNTIAGQYFAQKALKTPFLTRDSIPIDPPCGRTITLQLGFIVPLNRLKPAF